MKGKTGLGMQAWLSVQREKTARSKTLGEIADEMGVDVVDLAQHISAILRGQRPKPLNRKSK